MRRHSPSPSFASERPNSNIFSPLVKAAGWLLQGMESWRGIYMIMNIEHIIGHNSIYPTRPPLSFGNPFYLQLFGKVALQMPSREVLLLLGHISQVAIWNCPILRTARSQMSSPPHLACLSTGQKAALSLVHCALGHRAFHGWPIMVPSSPSGPSLHSAAFPSQCKTLPTPTGLEDKYFPGKRHKWRGLGHCKVGRFPQWS